MAASQPEVSEISDSGSETSQVTVTSDRYQPWLPPSVPLTFARTTGFVRSSVPGRQNHAPRHALGVSGPSRSVDTPKPASNTGCVKPAPAFSGAPSRSEAVQPFTEA